MVKTRSHEDPVAISQYSFDEDKKAMRVTIVGNGFGEQPHSHKVQSGQISPVPSQVIVKETEIKVVEIPVIVKEIQIERVEVPTVIIQKEVQFVDVPVYVKGETLEVLKEIPIYITEVKTIEIEKPVYITKTEYKDLPKFLMAFLALNALVTLFLTLHK